MTELETTPAPRSHVGRRPTIRDVAAVAGVSYGTVSRHLNGGRWVGAESAAAIDDAIARTGFRPNRTARSLATGRSLAVAFLFTEPQERLFADPNYSILLRHVTAALADRGHSTVLITASTPAERQRALDFLVGHVAGVVLVAPHVGDPLLADLVRAGVPVVSCGRPLGWEDRISSVSADDHVGGRLATEHLLADGRRRVAMITGPRGVGGALEREEGYREALAAAGLAVDDDLVAEGDWSHASGRRAMAEILGRTRPDAVFAGNDAMATGAIAVLRAAGLHIPGDVSVIGFDDTGVAATCDPPLSTVRQPFDLLGREMVRVLLDREEATAPDVLRLRLPVQLTLRATTPAP